MDSILCKSREVYLKSIDACMRHMCQGVQQICFDSALHIGLLRLQGSQGCLKVRKAATLCRSALGALHKLDVYQSSQAYTCAIGGRKTRVLFLLVLLTLIA